MSTLSRTLITGNSWRASGTWMRPRPTMSAGAMPAMSVPSNVMRPALGFTSPEMARSSVVLPAPLAPMMVTTSPRPTSMDTS